MKIQVLGPGCANCKKLEANTKEALKELGLEAEVVKVTDIQEIMKMGVMSTPGLAVDSVVKSFGKVLTKDQVVEILKRI